MYQEKEYEAFIGNNGMIVLAIQVRPGEPDKPSIMYDGGVHALLCRSDRDDDIVLLDVKTNGR